MNRVDSMSWKSTGASSDTGRHIWSCVGARDVDVVILYSLRLPLDRVNSVNRTARPGTDAVSSLFLPEIGELPSSRTAGQMIESCINSPNMG